MNDRIKEFSGHTHQLNVVLSEFDLDSDLFAKKKNEVWPETKYRLKFKKGFISLHLRSCFVFWKKKKNSFYP